MKIHKKKVKIREQGDQATIGRNLLNAEISKMNYNTVQDSSKITERRERSGEKATTEPDTGQ